MKHHAFVRGAVTSFFGIIFAIGLFFQSPVQTFGAENGTCNCSGSFSGDVKFIPTDEFDTKICPAVKKVCDQCAAGVASTCQLQFPTSKETCDSFGGKDPGAVLTYFGVPDEYEININPNMVCKFFAGNGAPGTAGTVTKDAATAKIPPLSNPLGTTSIPEFLGRIVNAFLGISGSLALLMFVYGGFTWISSGGAPDKIKQGKDTLVWAAIGIAFIFSSYALISFVIKAFNAAGQ